MSVTGKVLTIFRPRLYFSLLTRCTRPCAVLSQKNLFNYTTWNNSLQIQPHRRTLFKKNSQVRTMSALSPLDPSSFSRPDIALVKHISLSLAVDFEKKVLNGNAVLTVEAVKDTNEVILDASNLTIQSIETEDGSSMQYNLAEAIPNYGSKLTITLPKTLSSGEKNDFVIKRCRTERQESGLGYPSLTDHKAKDTSMCVNFAGLLRRPLSDSDLVVSKEKKAKCRYCGRSVTNQINMDTPGRDNSAITCPTIPLTFNGLLYRPVSDPGVSCEVNKVAETDSGMSCKVNEVAETDSGMSCKVNDVEVPSATKSREVDIGLRMACCRKPKQTTKQTTSAISGQENGVKIKVNYTTSPSASALQWLEPSQTSGKQHPYLFSQCQPIHARSIMPCQDTPAVKFTYDAEVSAPEPFTVLMSAIRGESNGTKTSFRQPVPVPSYLLAIAVGVLQSRRLGPRSLVWSEAQEIERSAWEFADTEKYLQAAERLCGAYVWGQYDLLVLPPSFPYGGMENPCLTFVTPTLLAGDRSQADVIVHEIMHSWTGNLVTNRNFEHFWLNEGFTVFLERKVGASLIADPAEAKRSRDFHSILGLQELSETVHDHFGPSSPLTKLVVDLKGVHPDDAFSRVPYEKGSLFLRYLEDLVGGPEVFDDFLRAYLNEYQRKSLDTDQFKTFLLNYFKDNANLKTVDWNAWLYTSGMPPCIPNYDNSMTKAITTLLGKIEHSNATLSYDDVKDFTPHQIINLLQELIDRPALPIKSLRTLGSTYKVDSATNSEILYRWLRLCVRSKELEKLPEVFNFVNHQGRMKYVRPIYRDLYAWEDARQRAIDNFLANEKYMMHVSAYTVRKDLHLDS